MYPKFDVYGLSN